jgi:serine/threonine-protein kinase
VFRAHDPVEGRLVAVKTFHLDLTPEAAAGLVGELQSLVAKDLTHPSIASPLAAGLSGATPWLAQAYVPAESLDGALRQYGPAPTAHVVTVVTHLAGALDFAAVSGVVHGSLHPRDVLVAPDETFLLDLGVAGALERCGLRPPVRRPYSAPERIAGARVSRPADIFALAAIAFELLSGRPIAGPDGASVATLPDVHGADTAELRRVLASALATDPAARPESALAFAAAFKAALGTASFRATPAVEARRPHRVTPAPPLPLEPDADETAGATDAPIPERELTPAVESHEPRAVTIRDGSTAAPVLSVHDLDLKEPGHTVSEPLRAARRRSMSVPVLAAFVLLAVLSGFGLGWLWISSGGDPGQSTAGLPAAGEPRAETEHAVTGAEPGEGDAAPEPASVSEPPPPQADVVPAPPAPSAGAATGTPPPAARQRRPGTPLVRGRLQVRSTPEGARVEVNGRDRGRTPLTLGDLPLGGHTVVVSRPGFRPERRRVTLTRTRTTQTLRVPLRATGTAAVPAPERPAVPDRAESEGFVGSIVVETRPTTARVFIDGREAGRTPLVVPNVRAGSHVVRIELDGHRTWTSSVRVVAGERRRVTASLEELSR